MLKSDFIKDRLKYSYEGIILVSIIIYKDLTIDKDIKISLNGLPEYIYPYIIDNFKEFFIDQYIEISDQNKLSDLIIEELIKKTIRNLLKKESIRKPSIQSHILRI